MYYKAYQNNSAATLNKQKLPIKIVIEAEVIFI